MVDALERSHVGPRTALGRLTISCDWLQRHTQCLCPLQALPSQAGTPKQAGEGQAGDTSNTSTWGAEAGSTPSPRMSQSSVPNNGAGGRMLHQVNDVSDERTCLTCLNSTFVLLSSGALFCGVHKAVIP